VSSNGPVCAGSPLNLSTTNTAGATYAWTGPNGFISSLQNPTISAATTAATGTYSLTVTVNNCTSAAGSTSVTVNPIPSTPTVTSNAPICAGSSLNLSTANIAGATYAWVGPNGFGSSSQNPTITNAATSATGTYLVTVTVNGCSNTSQISASVNASPLLVITDPSAICSPQTVNLFSPAITAGSTAGLIYTYWTNAAATTPLSTPAAVNSAGVFYIKGVSPVTGCSDSKPVRVIINASPVLTITNPTAVCEPNTVDITRPAVTAGSTAGLVFSYWTDAANSTALVTPAAITASGTYYIRGQSAANNCSASMPVQVSVNPLPKGNMVLPAVNYICEGSSLLLNTSSDAFSQQWYLGQQAITGATASAYTATSAGKYSVQFFSKEGCSITAANTVTLNLLTKPLIQFSVGARCVGSTVNFTNNSNTTSSGAVNWIWDFGDGSSSNDFSPSHIYTTGGVYTVSVTANTLSCPSLSQKFSTSYGIETPRPGIRYDTVQAVSGKNIVLNARPFGVKYLWQPAAGLTNPVIVSPTANLTADKDYTITITSAPGCVTADSVYVKVTGVGEIYVAGGFTPNGDGINDKAFPILKGIRSLTYFKIYNRWGNLLFQTNDDTPGNGWDGKYGGKLQPAGTYTWIAEAVDGKGVVIRRSGNFLLIY
jgi:gliding motility-associated-like protein